MTEHVHEWEIKQFGRHGTIVECECGAEMTTKQAEARLNATARLSAKVARRNGAILRINVDRLPYKAQTQGFRDSQDMLAYADTLEGK